MEEGEGEGRREGGGRREIYIYIGSIKQHHSEGTCTYTFHICRS